MANIRNRRIIQEAIDKLRLLRNLEKVPDEIISKVMPTFVMNETGRFRVHRDTTLNSSNKTITVPPDVDWTIESIHVNYTASAEVGSRRPTVRILDTAGNVIWTATSGTAITASSVTNVLFQGDVSLAGLLNVQISVPGPKTALAGFAVQVLDSGAVDAAVDDMLVNIMYFEKSRQRSD